MARYAITYTCGHSGDVNLIGPARSRESRLAYLEKGECFECYKQHSTEAAREQAKDLELPPLVGTQNRIAYAETLRIQKLMEIEATVERLEKDDQYRQVLIAVEKISNETSAKQWIEWRYDLPERIIVNMLKAMMAVPTKEQKQVEQEAQEKARAVERVALVEATIRPASSVSEMAAEISLSGNTVSVVFPERREDFREIVRSIGYCWNNGQWQRKIGTFAGTVTDRAVELGHTLLSHGFLVRIFDDVLRSRIVAGDFTPEQTRWITSSTDDWFMIRWGHQEDYYDAARKLKNSKYDRPHVVIVPAVQFKQVLDFAEMHDFQLSNGAQELVQQAKEDKANMLVATKARMELREKKPATPDVPPILPVPELVAIADDLKDEI